MGCCNDGQPVVELDVGIAATKRNAQSRHATVEAFMVAHQERLSVFVANATHLQLELLRDSFANKQRLRIWRASHSVGLREIVLAPFPGMCT